MSVAGPDRPPAILRPPSNERSRDVNQSDGSGNVYGEMLQATAERGYARVEVNAALHTKPFDFYLVSDLGILQSGRMSSKVTRQIWHLWYVRVHRLLLSILIAPLWQAKRLAERERQRSRWFGL